MAIALVYGRNNGDVFGDLRLNAFGLNHRGQECCDISLYSGKEFLSRHIDGTVSPLLPQNEMKGPFGILQNSSTRNVRIKKSYAQNLGDFTLAFDGYFRNGDELRSRYGGSDDAELVARFIANAGDVVRGIENIINETSDNGCFSLVILTEKGDGFAARCPYGTVPLILGRSQDAYTVSTESRSFVKTSSVIERDVLPGEVVHIGQNGFETVKQFLANPHICSFHHPYYAAPNSVIERLPVDLARHLFGGALAMQDRQDGILVQVVTPIPASGIMHAEGYALEYPCRFANILNKDSYAERSYDKPEQDERDSVADTKQYVLVRLASGQVVAVVDDSFRRGTQAAKKGGPVDMVRSAGPREIHVRAGSPRNHAYCRLQPPHKGEYRDHMLAANRFTTDEKFARFLNVDTVRFISLENFLDILSDGTGRPRKDFCTGCYTADFGFLKAAA